VLFAGHNYIGMEHLLQGLSQEDEGVAAWVLENLGAGSSNICTQAGANPHKIS
jgi:ATP-dependent Clp protease ATP-binding subunit ClpC